MADWLNIAGGAGAGYVQGTEDNRRREEFNSLQRQRKRVEAQQAIDDQLAANAAKVRKPGTYEDEEAVPQGQETEPGFRGPPSGVKKTKTTVTEPEYLRNLANVVGGGGRLQDIQARGALTTQAFQAEQMARQERQAKGFETLSQAEQMLADGNHVGALRLLQQSYKQVPDGHDIVIEDRNGVPHMGVAAAGRYVEPPKPVTPAAVKEMINRGYAMLSPESRQAERKYGLEARTVGAQETTAGAHVTTADAAAKNAATQAAELMYKTTGDYAQAELAYKRSLAASGFAHANAYNAMAKAAGTKQTAGEKTQELIDTYLPIVKMANPGISEGQAQMLAARMATPGGRDPTMRQMTDVQSKAMDRLKEMEKAGAFEGKGGRMKRDEFITTNKLDEFIDLDPVTKAMMAAKPPQEAGAAAATTPAPAAPAVDTHKYNRAKVRSGYDYTLTSRGGKTKAEWAAEDAKMGIAR